MTIVNGASEDVRASFCDRCGEATEHPNSANCAAARSLEPPRYCGRCRRRLVVQVTPTGWTAHCSEHGLLKN